VQKSVETQTHAQEMRFLCFIFATSEKIFLQASDLRLATVCAFPDIIPVDFAWCAGTRNSPWQTGAATYVRYRTSKLIYTIENK
jgi:hypothetical protein